MRSRGSVLVGLLWCLALLSVVVVGFLHSTRLELQVAKNHADTVQAYYLAWAGVEKAKALIHADAAERRRSRVHHNGALYNAPEHFREVPLGRGEFSVFRNPRPDEPPGWVYGVSDEESRLNLNHASEEELGRLPGMTPELVAAILDWRDEDNETRPGGAEADFYQTLQPPRRPRNGPFQTVAELLMVRGVPRRLFFGEDTNGNGLLDPEEDDGDESFPPDNRDGRLEAGWAGWLTVFSTDDNRNAAGEERIDVTRADAATLAAVPGLNQEIAQAIVAWRGQHRIEALADLLDVTPPAPNAPGAAPAAGAPGGNPRTIAAPPGAAVGPGPLPATVVRSGGPAPVSPGGTPGAASPAATAAGPKLISPRLLMDIADDLTVGDRRQPGAVNINTAPVEVLACLPGLDRQLAQAIVAHRRSAGFFPNVAALLEVDGITPAILKRLEPRITVRSDTYRILSEGRVKSSGARQRLEVIVRYADSELVTLAYREVL